MEDLQFVERKCRFCGGTLVAQPERTTTQFVFFRSSVRLKFEQFQLIVGDGVFVDRVAALNRLL
jgi:hypothetical protein